jgi:hypothetical protein
LYSSECLKHTKTGMEASIASMMGALNPGALMASTDRPKHRYVIMSIVMQRKAQKRSAGLPARLWRSSAAHSELIYFPTVSISLPGLRCASKTQMPTFSTMRSCDCSTAFAENMRFRTSLRSLASL